MELSFLCSTRLHRARCWMSHRDQTPVMENARKLSQKTARIISQIPTIFRTWKLYSRYVAMTGPTSSWGRSPWVSWPFPRAKSVPSLSHKILLTAWIGLSSRWLAHGFCVVILRPSLIAMCPLARKKYVWMLGVLTQNELCVTLAEGRAQYSDYSVTFTLKLRRAPSACCWLRMNTARK